jgi:hypothetical protein
MMETHLLVFSKEISPFMTFFKNAIAMFIKEWMYIKAHKKRGDKKLHGLSP